MRAKTMKETLSAIESIYNALEGFENEEADRVLQIVNEQRARDRKNRPRLAAPSGSACDDCGVMIEGMGYVNRLGERRCESCKLIAESRA